MILILVLYSVSVIFSCRGELADLLHQQDWGNKSQRYYLNRQDTYEGALKAALGIWSVSIVLVSPAYTTS